MKTSIQNIYRALRWLKQVTLVCLIMLVATGCKKDKPGATNNDTAFDDSTIKFVLNDNFNFSIVYGALAYTGMTDTLAKPGPYTFLAPDDDAFTLVSMPPPVGKNTFQFYTQMQLVNLVRYCVLPGKIAFKQEPLVQNKPLLTATGGNVYLSRFLNGTDTVTTINGLTLKSVDNAASNGYIQVLPQVPNAAIYSNAMDYMHNDTSLTLFAAALHRANLDVALTGKDVYTLLAPSNAAFQKSAGLGLNVGISTLDSIFMADPVKLAAILKYHIIQDRFFEGDLYRYATTHPDGIATLDGGNVIIGGNPAGLHAITFTGSGNGGVPAVIAAPLTYNPAVNNANIPCGNAVIHKIDRILVK